MRQHKHDTQSAVRSSYVAAVTDLNVCVNQALLQALHHS